MLEEAFAHIMATEATVDSGAVGGEQPKSDVGDEQPKSDEAKLTNSSLVPSTVITTETLRRAKALGRYFSGQRDILFRVSYLFTYLRLTANDSGQMEIGKLFIR